MAPAEEGEGLASQPPVGGAATQVPVQGEQRPTSEQSRQVLAEFVIMLAARCVCVCVCCACACVCTYVVCVFVCVCMCVYGVFVCVVCGVHMWCGVCAWVDGWVSELAAFSFFLLFSADQTQMGYVTSNDFIQVLTAVQ